MQLHSIRLQEIHVHVNVSETGLHVIGQFAYM